MSVLHRLLAPTALLVCLLLSATDAHARRRSLTCLDPTTYSSPSGDYSLYVNPGKLYGQGPGDHRLSLKGDVVWEKQLPFTLWKAEVTDDGVVLGYAYSSGWENIPLKSDASDERQLYIVIIAPNGDFRLKDALPRYGGGTDRSVEGIAVDVEHDRFFVRTRNGWGPPFRQTWRVYRISDGASLDGFEFTPPGCDEGCSPILNARPTPGAPLILVNWKQRIAGGFMPTDGYDGKFALIDFAGRCVWEFVAEEDYIHKDYYRDIRNNARRKRLSALYAYVEKHGAILASDVPGQFALWIVALNQRVIFEVKPDAAAANGWSVREVRRERYAPVIEEEQEPAGSPVTRDISLRHLGSIELHRDPTTPYAATAMGDIFAVHVGQSGDIYLLRHFGSAAHVFDSSGRPTRVLRPNSTDFARVLGTPSITTFADGGTLIGAVEFDAAGQRTRRRTPPADVDVRLNTEIYCAQPTPGRVWVIGDRQATLLDKDDTVLKVVDRRADDYWLDMIDLAASAPDGGLAIVAHPRDTSPKSPAGPSLTVYDARGVPLLTAGLPTIAGVPKWWPSSLEYNGRWAILHGCKPPVALDTRADPPQWCNIKIDHPYQDSWSWAFAKNGEELWLIALRALRVERYAIVSPDAVEQTDERSAPSATTD